MAGLINLLSLAKFRGPTQTLTDRRLKFSANKQQTELQKQLAKSWQEAGKKKRNTWKSLFASGVCRFNVA